MLFCCVAFLFSPFLDDVLNSDLWASAICDSAYFDKVFNSYIPTMTNNTTENITVSASNSQTSTPAYMAFDKNIDTQWCTEHSVTVSNTYLKCNLPEQVVVRIIEIQPQRVGSTANSNSVTISLYGSNDEATYTKITDILINSAESKTKKRKIVNNNSSYKYYKITFSGYTITAESIYSYVTIAELQLYCK